MTRSDPMAKGFVEVNGIEVVRVSEGGGQPPFVEAVFQTSLVVLAGKERAPNSDLWLPSVNEKKVPPNARHSARLWASHDFYACQMGRSWAGRRVLMPF